MSNKRRIIILSTLAAALAAAVLVYIFAWRKGAFLPSWIKWQEVSITTECSRAEAAGTEPETKAAGTELGYEGTGTEPGLKDSDGSDNQKDSVTVTVGNKRAAAYNAAGDKLWELEEDALASDALFADIDRDGADELLVLCWKIGRYGNRKPFWIKKDVSKWVQHIYIYEVTPDKVRPKWMSSNIGKNVLSWEALEDGMIACTAPDGMTSTWRWISWGLEKVSEYGVNESGADDEPENADIKDGLGADGEMNAGDNDIGALDAGNSDPDAEDAGTSCEIVMVGDILLHDGVTESCTLEDGGYDFDPIFAHTKEKITQADLAIVNQEVILGGKELRVSGYPSFNAPFEVADALSNAGFDVVCHATNHALDRGKKGIINCLDNWKSAHPEMAVIGIYDSEQAAEEVYITKVCSDDCQSNDADAIRIAVLNYTYGTNGIALPSDMPYAVSMLNKEAIASDLEYAREHADFIIVCPHWGIEYQLTPSSEQVEMAKFMADNGADLIIGTHPHVIEPVEYVEGDNGGRALCYYSLGNYINWTSGRGQDVSNRMVGFMADVIIERDENGDVVISDYEAIPLISHVESNKGKVMTYFLDDYTEELAEGNEIKEQDDEFSIEKAKELVRKVTESESGDVIAYGI